MARTDMLRRQHEAAEELAGEILENLEGASERPSAYALTLTLAKLHGLLRVHLAQEDKSLYPVMIASTDDRAARTAAEFRAEMGGLSKAFGDYVEHWGSASRIEAHFDRFAAETKAIFGALAMRIRRENEQLYPLADALQDPGARAA